MWRHNRPDRYGPRIHHHDVTRVFPSSAATGGVAILIWLGHWLLTSYLQGTIKSESEPGQYFPRRSTLHVLVLIKSNWIFTSHILCSMSASTRIILRKKQCPESTLISHFSIKSSYPLRKKEWVDRSLSLILKLRFERLRPGCDSRGLLSKRGRISKRGRKERIVHPTVAVKRTCDLSYASSRLNAVSSPRAYT